MLGSEMKVLQIACLLCTIVLPTVLQAQFTFTTNNGSITITGYTGSGGVVAIPDTTNGYAVTSIGSSAFYRGFSITSVVIPKGITTIGDYAFYLCNRMTNVAIPNGVTTIGFSAFAGSSSLTSITIPNSVTGIGDDSFLNCSSLTSVTIPNSITSIPDLAFANCTGLGKVTISASVTGIGQSAFARCPALTEVNFQGNAPTFGADVFKNANNVILFYLPGTTGWDSILFVPKMLWFLPNPTILDFEPDFGIHTNRFGFTISWATNVPVVVEVCTNLSRSVWSPLVTNTLAGGSSYFSDQRWTNFPARFYRLRSP